jgi:hypothetical protein
MLSFQEAAKRINRTKVTLHMLARRGAFKKTLFPGSTRCAGIRESEVERLMSGTN